MILNGKKVRNELLEYYENKIKEENIKITPILMRKATQKNRIKSKNPNFIFLPYSRLPTGFCR